MLVTESTFPARVLILYVGVEEFEPDMAWIPVAMPTLKRMVRMNALVTFILLFT